MNEKAEIRKLTPLTETSFYVLISLLEPLHGYGIMQKVEKLSNGRIIFGPGTLYGAINNLQSIGLISLYGSTTSNERKKTYLVTDNGRELIDFEIARLKDMVKNAEMLIENANNNV